MCIRMLSVYIGAPVVSGIVHECVSLLYQCLLLINANSLPALKSSTFGVRFFFFSFIKCRRYL